MSRIPFARRTLLAGFSALALSGCVETAADFDPAAPPRAKAPSGMPVALVSLEGAPEAVTARLSTAIAGQAARRDLVIVGIDGKPRYQIRGHLAAYPGAEGKGELSWTFDIYDEQKKRARRISGQEALASGSDWSAVGDAQLQTVAFKALDEIAAFLAAAPEAVAAGVGRQGSAGARRAAGLLAGG